MNRRTTVFALMLGTIIGSAGSVVAPPDLLGASQAQAKTKINWVSAGSNQVSSSGQVSNRHEGGGGGSDDDSDDSDDNHDDHDGGDDQGGDGGHDGGSDD